MGAVEPDAANEGTPSPGEGQVFLDTGEAATAEHLRNAYRLSEPTLAELALEPLLQELLNRTREILGVDTVAVLLIDPEDRSLVARAARGIEEEVERGVRIPIGRGFAGRIAAERRAIFIADVDHADVLNPILREKGIRSLLGVPLIVDGRVVGVLHVGTLTPRTFTSDDAAVLALAAARAAPAIERARLFDALEHEHRAAVTLQRSLLPEILPEIVGVEIAARYFPARDVVGGDWYDVIELPRGRVGLAIGDVAGHGVPAAALMGQLRTGLRAYALDGHPPGEALGRLDRLLQTIRGQEMATAAFAVIDTETGTLRCATAGHPPPVVVSTAGEARLMEVRTAPPLGAFPYVTYEEVELALRPDEKLLLYTDGLVERRRESLETGLERLRVAAGATTSAEALCRAVSTALAPEEGARDDVALVALRYLPVEDELRVRSPADANALVRIRRLLRRWLRAHGARPEEVGAITLACGEACANAIEHAYAPGLAFFELEAVHAAGVVTLTVRDSGRWREPRGADRGRGLRIIEAAVDELDVRSTAAGTEVRMRRWLRA
jgi:serine phosphatase RsbU (regulator of sigma subunit)/anti-sigma regulatory factor (Ser/Thr protein kinase)